MQLVEKHVIKKTDPRFAALDRAAFASKNLYNAALYEIRQHFIFTGKYVNYNAIDKIMQKHEAYRALPTKVPQQVLKLLDKNWTSFFAALRAYKDDPSRFLGRPKLPGYKDKQAGRNVLVYTIQALSQPALRQGIIKPSQLGIEVRTRQRNVDQVRIVPTRSGCYVVEVVYTQVEEQKALDPSLVAAVDIGVNNLVALTSNKPGFVPRLVNGRSIKSVNQRYNKQAANMRRKMSHNHHTSQTLERVSAKRTRRIDHCMHTVSRCIIDVLVIEQIATLVIGKNPGWKQESTMSKKNNQHFVQLPHARFIDMLTYKATLVGIAVMVQEESYTSKASFLDLDTIPVYGKTGEEKPVFSGKRIARGLYKAKSGRAFNADVNGSYNILRKALPDAFSNGIKDVNKTLVVLPASLVVHPVRIVIPSKLKMSRKR
ncbi:transposase [Dictyobacter vulcani]|uniref:Transposase n=1 Tax=Dictyobacter vulcani TaxID=2607529 RepID=A0A5J4KBW9_9CHLR|nr:RNA-guided endonuclease TnpB family protein [Dictyobacter vulcani]GER86204.1 transposase [Dictyobacter vulcani]